jgi:hypothetical protein
MYEINLKELREYQNRVKKWPEKGYANEKFSMEQNTIIKFTVPLLEALGWDTKSELVEFEYTVKSVGERIRKIRVDVALYVPGHSTPQVLVEVKRMRKPFESGKYLLRYLNKNSKVKYGIFTNGEELKLIDNTTRKDFEPSGLFSIRAEDFHNWPEALSLLSFDSVKEGVLNDFVEAYHDKFWGWHNEEIKSKKHTDYELRLIFAKCKWRELVKAG